MAAVKQKSNLLSNLLGLDENPGQGMAQPLQGQATKEVERPQSGWGATLQSLKLSDALQGINVTPNFLFLLLFLGFAGWLWVVYWIRHNEPLANSVLGTHTAQSTTTHADRSMLAGIKKTLPVRTSNNMGDYYVPIPHQGGIAASGDYGHGGAGAYAYPPHTALPAHSPAHPQAVVPQQHAMMPTPSMPVPQPMPMPAPPQPTPLSYNYNPYAAPQQPYYQPHGTAYMVPVQQPQGTRLKTVVHR
jgi:hypothetical protein